MQHTIGLTITLSLFFNFAFADVKNQTSFQDQTINKISIPSIEDLNKDSSKSNGISIDSDSNNIPISAKSTNNEIIDNKDKLADDKNSKNQSSLPMTQPTDVPTQSKDGNVKDSKLNWNNKSITISTGSLTGVYYSAGGAICRMISRSKKDSKFRCGVESTAGSVYNINSLRSGDVDFAIVQSDWQEHAFDGNNIFKNQGSFDKLRFVFSLYNEAFTVIVRKDSDINKLDDIAGKIVNIGYPNSGVRATTETMMSIKGWTNSTFKAATEYKPEDQGKLLCDKKIDVMIISSGHPNAIVQDVMSLCDSKIIPIEDADIAAYIQKNGEFANATIVGGLYNGSPFDVKTFGIKATLVTTSDTSDDTVYNLIKAVFENLNNFKKLHPVFYNLTPNAMVLEGKIAPMHPAAVKYFTEKGYIKQ